MTDSIIADETDLIEKENNFIDQIKEDLTIRNGRVPSNEEIMKEVIYRAMYIW